MQDTPFDRQTAARFSSLKALFSEGPRCVCACGERKNDEHFFRLDDPALLDYLDRADNKSSALWELITIGLDAKLSTTLPFMIVARVMSELKIQIVANLRAKSLAFRFVYRLRLWRSL